MTNQLSRRVRRPEAALLATIVLVAAGVRVSMVRHQGLWTDELFSLAMATGHSLEHPAAEADPARGDFVEESDAVPPTVYARYLRHDDPPASPGRVLRAVELSDTSPPFYYLVLWGWTRLVGTGDAALRLLSVVFSIPALVLTALVARRAFGPAALLPTAALSAASPFGLYYATEGRMYALVCLWVAATLLLALRLRSRGDAWTRLAGFVLVGGAGLLTHYFFAPVWAAVQAWLLATPGRSRRGRLALAALASLVLAAPWYVRLPASLGRWRVTAGWLNVIPPGYDPWRAPFEAAWGLAIGRGTWGVPLVLDVASLGALLVLAVLVFRRLRGRLVLPPARALLWIAAAAGLGTPVAFDLVMKTHTTLFPRFAIAALPATGALLGGTLGKLPLRPRVAVASILVGVTMVGSWGVWRAPSRNAQPIRWVAGQIATRSSPKDVVIARGIPSAVCGLARYLEARTTATAPPAPLAAWVSQLGRREVPRDVARLAEGHQRVLLVTLVRTATDRPLGEEDWLRRNARLVSSEALEAMSVLVFEPPDPTRSTSATPP